MARETSIINKFGKVTGWNSVTVRVLGRDLVGITELEYDDEQAMENVYGAGSMPIGQSDGNYEAKASITLTQEEKFNLLDSLEKGKRIQDIPAFDMIVTFTYNEKTYTNKIRNCRFMKNGVAVKQGDKSITYKYELLITHIDWK
ncbi:hypothetical protein [Tenacibaculum maritimum]|uniref:hypothetical protein n=1 Tax=Tenacibaculum maritimum TaxID=107401 RepID=UPI0012E48D4A|nr:hypothetical protein [Tenacibaculum maritimum]MDB0599794.1 hypothetical protein [Tenacibaculum maritimum]MDB0610904.1 hypothetical protein [Tenacibaculum maritimum]CAA0231990.1 conserved hypothetical protein [Tenacibaculum maritimum]